MTRKKHPNKNVKQTQVPCPRKVRKAILRNLWKTAKNRFNKSRAQKAAQLLERLIQSSLKNTEIMEAKK